MLISLKEYAEKVGRDPSTIRHKIICGNLPAVKIGSQWAVDSETPYADCRVKTGEYKNWRKKEDT